MTCIINRHLKTINRYSALMISILFALRVGAETNEPFHTDFEGMTNLQGWSIGNAPSNIVRIVGVPEITPHSGKQCLAITAWQKSGKGLRTIITSEDKIPVAVGDKIKISAWAQSRESGLILAGISHCYDESGKTLSTDWPVFQPPLTSEWTRVECETRVLKIASKSFSMSLDVRGSAGTVYLDDLSITVIPGKFSDLYNKINLVDSNPMMEPSKDQQEQGYILFKRSYLDIVYPALKPKKEEILKSIAIFAAPGEYEPATVSIHTLKELKNVTVKITDLRAADGKVLASTNITVGSVRCWNKHEAGWQPRTITFYADMPTFIEQKNEVNLPANISHTFWLTIKVPEDAAAGIYSGKINITCDNGKPSEIQLKCKVLPFKLAPVPQGKYFSLYYQAGALEDLLPPAVAFKDMQEHGSTGIGLCWIDAIPDYSKVVWDGTNATIDIPSTNLFAQVVEEYKKVFSEPLLWLTMPEDFEGYALKYGGPIGSPEFAVLYKALVKGIVAYGKAKGWPEFIFQAKDEPAWYGAAGMKTSLIMNKLLKEAGVRVELNGPNDDFLFKESAPYVDMFTSTTLPSKEEMAELHKQNKRVVLYNVEESGYHPEVLRFLLGFHMWSRDGDGINNWSYCDASSSIYDDLDTPSQGYIFRYRPSGKETGGPSTSFEGFREGIDDYRYLVTLNQAINELRHSSKKSDLEKAVTIQKELDKILSSMAFSHNRDSWAVGPNGRPNKRWRKEYRDKAGNVCYEGPWKVRNGWSLEDYDKARWRVACLIMEAKGLK